MRLMISVLALAGCMGDPDDKSFQVAEPTAGATLDRCNVRVRTTPPVPVATVGPGGGGLEGGDHVNWRLDGGRETEVKQIYVNRMDRANMVFGATLVSGAQNREVASCAEFDICDYHSVPVTVANASGAPDCEGPGGGQMLVGSPAAFSITPLADGRTVIGAGGGASTLYIYMLKADGTWDTTFGDMGKAKVPLFADHVVQLGDGSFFVLGSTNGLYLGHVFADGTVDEPFGMIFGDKGVRVLPCPTELGSDCKADVMRSDGAGGALFAGRSSMGTFIMELDGAANVTASTLVEADAMPRHAVSMEASGRTLFATGTELSIGTLAGLDTSFGTSGHMTVPAQGTSDPPPALAGALSGTHILVARQNFQSNTQILEMQAIEAGVAKPLVSIPLATANTVIGLGNLGDPQVAIDSTGRGYVAIGRERAPASDAWRSVDPGIETLTMRLVDGALDTTYGADGYATMTARDVWEPVATENLYDVPKKLALDADGAPWLLSSSQSFGTETDPYLLRGPGIVLAKLKP